MENRVAGGKVILSRLLWPERAEREEAVDESGLRCELGESAFAPSGDGDFKHRDRYSFFFFFLFFFGGGLDQLYTRAIRRGSENDPSHGGDFRRLGTRGTSSNIFILRRQRKQLRWLLGNLGASCLVSSVPSLRVIFSSPQLCVFASLALSKVFQMCQNNDMHVYIFCPRMLERRFLREPGRGRKKRKRKGKSPR